MREFEAYSIYHAVYLHFTTDYDAFKYKFKTRVNEQSFYKRRDKYFFSKAAKTYSTHDKLLDFYGAQYSDGNTKKHISDFFNDDGDKLYLDWQKKFQSFSWFFKNELTYLQDTYDTFDVLFVNDGMYPPIIKEYLSDSISAETVVALDKLLGFVRKINSKDILMWPDKQRFLLKYSPFVKVDTKKVKKITLEVFTL